MESPRRDGNKIYLHVSKNENGSYAAVRDAGGRYFFFIVG
jgi:hypothetical protein